MCVHKKDIQAYKIGQNVELTHLISGADVENFAKLTGDCNPIHMDEKYSRKMLLGKRVAHGMLTASFISRLIGEKLPGHDALWYEQTLRFLIPVHIGDTIRIVASIQHIAYSQNILVLKTEVFNQRNQLVLDGEAKVKILNSHQGISSAVPIAKENITTLAPLQAKFKKGAIIITGATGGIGSSTAKVLALKGYPLALQFHQNQAKAHELVTEIEQLGGHAICIEANLADHDGSAKVISESIKQFGLIYGIVHCAAPTIEEKSLIDMNWQDFQRQIDIQVKGGFNLIHAALPFMLEAKEGSVVNVISTAANNAPPEKWSAYALAKTALLSLTRAFANEMGPRGIRFNAISPGMTATEMIAQVPERAKMVSKMQSPLRKIAEPEEIAEVIEFLMSHAARHITGENLHVCGGTVMK